MTFAQSGYARPERASFALLTTVIAGRRLGDSHSSSPAIGMGAEEAVRERGDSNGFSALRGP